MRRPGRCVPMTATALLRDINSFYSYNFFFKTPVFTSSAEKGPS